MDVATACSASFSVLAALLTQHPVSAQPAHASGAQRLQTPINMLSSAVPFARAGTLTAEQVRVRCALTTAVELEVARVQLAARRRLQWRIGAFVSCLVTLALALMATPTIWLLSNAAGKGLAVYRQVRVPRARHSHLGNLHTLHDAFIAFVACIPRPYDGLPPFGPDLQVRNSECEVQPARPRVHTARRRTERF